MLARSEQIQTTVVGSYPQPEWLIDRKALASAPPPRIRQPSLWRISPEFLEAAQDDATLLAIRDMELAGVDIISDGEIRRESYSSSFATALEGVDQANPGQIIGRSGRPMLVPRVVGPIRRVRPVGVRDVGFLRKNTRRRIKTTIPGPFTVAQQCKDEYYGNKEALAMDYAACVNAEARDAAEAGADVVQLDEPWMQTYPEEARKYAVAAIDRAVQGLRCVTVVHSCFGYAAMIKEKPGKYPFLEELADSDAQQISIEAAQPKLDLSVLERMGKKTIILGVLNLGDYSIESPEAIAVRLREALRYTDPGRLIAAPDCGMKYLPKEVAFNKLEAMTKGASRLRGSLG